MTIHTELSFTASNGGTSQKVSISSTSAQSAVIHPGSGMGGLISILMVADVDCFCRQGLNPTAVADGTDQFIGAGNLFRVNVLRANKLAFITTSATGNVYITPEI